MTTSAAVLRLNTAKSRHSTQTSKHMNPVSTSRALVQESFANAGKWNANMAEAESLLTSALNESSDDITALTCLGAVLCDQAKYQRATDMLKKAVELGSTDRNTYFNLGVALFAHAAQEEAMDAFRRAQSLDASPETWEAYFDPQAQ